MGCVRAYDRESMKSISLGSLNLTKLNRTSSSICIRSFLWNMAYGSGRTLHILGNLPFNFFRKQLQTLGITRTSLHNLIYHIWTHNNLDSDQAYATHGTFRFYWQDICITDEYKLKRTLIFKLGTTDMIEQSKTHPFNLSKRS